MRKHIYTIAVAVALTLLLPYAAQAQKFNKARKQPEKIYKIEEVISAPGVTEQIIEHTGFTVSYNENLLLPNWVAYELTPEEAAAEDVSRTDFFQRDPKVKGASAEDDDYRGSGYDRGHMAAAADMKWSEKAMEESFYFSNICPQNQKLNSGRWLELEQKCRYWAKKYKTSVYIVCGPIFVRPQAKYIGRNEILVPDAFFKVVAQQRDGRWVAAAFIMPNVDLSLELEQLAKPIVGLEQITGMKFLRNLPQQDLDAVYATVRAEDWIVKGWRN